MPDDVYFKYPPQLLAVHVPLLEHVVDRRKANPTQIQLSFNQMNIYEYIDEHDEDYTYHTYSMDIPATRQRAGAETRMVFAENNTCSRLLFGNPAARYAMTGILERSWSIITETTLRIRGDTMQLVDEGVEVLFTVHYWDEEMQVRYFKLLYFEKTMRSLFEAISRWRPPQLSLVQVKEFTYTI